MEQCRTNTYKKDLGSCLLSLSYSYNNGLIGDSTENQQNHVIYDVISPLTEYIFNCELLHNVCQLC